MWNVDVYVDVDIDIDTDMDMDMDWDDCRIGLMTKKFVFTFASTPFEINEH
jgi:hypothetical protein